MMIAIYLILGMKFQTSAFAPQSLPDEEEVDICAKFSQKSCHKNGMVGWHMEGDPKI